MSEESDKAGILLAEGPGALKVDLLGGVASSGLSASRKTRSPRLQVQL